MNFLTDCQPHGCLFDAPRLAWNETEWSRENHVTKILKSFSGNFAPYTRVDFMVARALDDLTDLLMYTVEGSEEETETIQLLRRLGVEGGDFVYDAVFKNNWERISSECLKQSIDYHEFATANNGVKVYLRDLPLGHQFRHEHATHMNRFLTALDLNKERCLKLVQKLPYASVTPHMSAFLVSQTKDFDLNNTPVEWVEEYYGFKLSNEHIHVNKNFVTQSEVH